MICPDCNGNGEAIYYEYLGTDFTKNIVNIKPKKDICRTCNGSGHTTQTNADRIRAMSDEELAETLALLQTNFAVLLLEKLECPTEETAACLEETKKEFLEWLKQTSK